MIKGIKEGFMALKQLRSYVKKCFGVYPTKTNGVMIYDASIDGSYVPNNLIKAVHVGEMMFDHAQDLPCVHTQNDFLDFNAAISEKFPDSYMVEQVQNVVRGKGLNPIPKDLYDGEYLPVPV